MNNNTNNTNSNAVVLVDSIDNNRDVIVTPSKNSNRLATYSNEHHFSVDTGNKNLDAITTNILNCNEIGENMLYLTAVNLAFVKENKEFFNGTHFKNLEQYGAEMFGYKKAWCYKLANASKFINVVKRVRKANDTIEKVEFNPFEHFDISDLEINVLSDIDGFRFSVGKLDLLTKCSDDEIKALIDTEVIDSTSTEKDILRAVNSIKGIEDKKSKSNETAENAENGVDTDDTDNKVAYKLTTDTDRINAILDIIKGMENTQFKDTIHRAVEKCKTGDTNK